MVLEVSIFGLFIIKSQNLKSSSPTNDILEMADRQTWEGNTKTAIHLKFEDFCCKILLSPVSELSARWGLQ